jgi:hypothetical protein
VLVFSFVVDGDADDGEDETEAAAATGATAEVGDAEVELPFRSKRSFSATVFFLEGFELDRSDYVRREKKGKKVSRVESFPLCFSSSLPTSFVSSLCLPYSIASIVPVAIISSLRRRTSARRANCRSLHR